MRKSLFSKIFITQIVVAFTVVLIVIPMIFIMIGEYFVSVQRDDILDDASRVAQLTEQIVDVGTDEKTWEFFKSGIEFVGGQSSLLVVNSRGEVIAAPKNLSGINLSLIDESFLKGVKNGRPEVKLYESGRLFSEQTIVAIVPILKFDRISGKNNFLGASVAFRQTPIIKRIQYKIIKIMLTAQVFAWLTALIVSFIITRQITKPVKKMGIATKKIASGNFSVQIPVTSNDEIGALAKSFNSMTESLCELENMRQSFLSDISHELRTPMTIIGGFVEGILDGTIPKEQQKKYLGIVLEETKRLSRLVKDLLDATRLEQGTIKINKVDFDVNRLMTESVISYEQQLSEKNISVNLSLEGKECFAFADKDAIKRVVINLIDNAIKFTPDSGKIIVKTYRKDGKVYASVENTGEGISKEDLKHIWERFYKSDKSRSVDKKGVGLGLHIVKTIITQHNGEVFAESEEGKYARFTFAIENGENKSGITEKRKDD